MNDPSRAATPSTQPEPELLREVIGERRRYEVLRRIGSGGMADVYLCTLHGGEGFQRTVALKVVRDDFAHRPAFCESFIQEARFVSLLSHSNIVNVIDFDRDGEGRLFLAMEYVDGRDLFALLDGRPLAPSVAIFIATEVLRALAYAHQLPNQSDVRGIVHRDISPQNILLSWSGAVKVADFGIAKALTTSGILSGFKGKASYMSPEQARGHVIDGRSDLFALGAVLWEMLTGKRLFRGVRPKEIAARILVGDVPLPSTILPVSADLEAVVMRLLRSEREERYPRAQDALADLVKCHDWPRNGPAELVALLAKRFPPGSQHAIPAAPGTVSAPETTSAGRTQTLQVTETGEDPAGEREDNSAEDRDYPGHASAVSTGSGPSLGFAGLADQVSASLAMVSGELPAAAVVSAAPTRGPRRHMWLLAAGATLAIVAAVLWLAS